MFIYLILFAIWGIAALILKPNRLSLNHHEKLRYILIGSIPLFFVMSLRSPSVGTDTFAYKYEFENAQYFLTQKLRDSEIGYSYFNSFFYNLGFNFQLYLATVSIFFIISLCLLYYYFSENILLSFYLHVTIGIFALSMTGIRQTLAIALTMIAFTFLQKNKKIWFIIFVLLASTFHDSAIFFLGIYFFRNIVVSKMIAWIIFIISTSAYIFRSYLIEFLELITPSSYLIYFTTSTNVNPMVIVISMAIPLTCLIFWPNDKIELSKERKQLFTITFILACVNYIISIVSQDISMLSRISSYLLIYSTILIPNIIFSIKNTKIRTIAKFACFLLPLVQFLLSTPGGSLGIDDYKFFWE